MKFLAVLLLLICGAVHAEPAAIDLPSGLLLPSEAQVGAGFDADRATDAYLNLLSPEQRDRSDAYFEGGYWLQLFTLLYGLGVAALLMAGPSQRMRALAERISARPWLSVAMYAAMWTLAMFALGLPLSLYADYFREHAYQLSEQPFGGWLGDQLKGLALSLVFAPLVITAIYAALRRAGARWWVYTTVLAFAVTLFAIMVTPVFVAPVFNQYQPLPEGPVKDAVFSLARANQIPTDHVEWFDASKQTTRISANVSGLWGTTRVNLNDNLLKKTSLPEIRAVLGHEMGHYVLNHSMKLSVYTTLVIGFSLYLLHRLFDRVLARWGGRLQLRDRADPAALPLAAALFSVITFLSTPLLNSIVRQCENEADAYGLNAAREPYGFASTAVRLSAYRKLNPGPIEEAIFFDHPSGYARVHRAMVWLKENPEAGAPAPAPPLP